MLELALNRHSKFSVRQLREIAEFFGFETRNKYEIVAEDGSVVAFAAEQQKGALGFLFRQWLGHWRSFEIHVFSALRKPVLIVRHPFRFFFKRLEVCDANGRFLGAIQQRFSILTKKFEVENEAGTVVMQVASPFWKIWTFPFVQNGEEVASVKKKWAGLFSEGFTDKDNFIVEFGSSRLDEKSRVLVLAAALFIDLRYFETHK